MFKSIFIEQVQRNISLLITVFGWWLIVGFVTLSLIALYFRLRGDTNGLQEIQNGHISKALDRLDKKQKEKRR